MSYSLEDQLKLLGSKRFEELCGQLVKTEHPAACHVEGSGGDEGIDIFDGVLDPAARSQSGGHLHVWQVKFFRDRIEAPQRRKVEKSLNRALVHKPDSWTLCLPVNLQINEARDWFQPLKKRHPGILINLLQADEIVSRISNNDKLFDAYFLRPPAPFLIDRILERLDDFSAVPQLLSNACKEPEMRSRVAEEFYEGAPADWSTIAFDLDAFREQFGELWTFVRRSVSQPGSRVPFGLITGRSGDGKTTVLMRLAAELVKQGYNAVFFHKEDKTTINVDQFLELKNNAVAFLLIDKITRFDANTLHSLFVRLRNHNIPAVVVGAAIESLWMALHKELADVAQTTSISLAEMTDSDIEALLGRLNQDPKYLGHLAGHSLAEQAEMFRNRADRQLLVALLEVKRNEQFESHIKREVGQIEALPRGTEIRRACSYVSAFHRLDIPMPRNLLARLLPEVDLDSEVLRHTKGLLLERSPHSDSITTRHPVIAEVLFPKGTDGLRCYERILDKTEGDESRLLGRAIHILGLRGERSLQLELLRRATHLKYASDVVFLHVFAMLTWEDGDRRKARWLFKKASKLPAADVYVWQSWGKLERELGNIGERLEPAEYTARWLFRKGAQTDPHHAPLWQAWALLESQEGNIGEWRNAEEYSARWLFGKGVEVDPTHGPVWQAWARLEAEQGNVGKWPDPLEYTARWLFWKGVESDPHNAPTWQAWALLEKNQRNIGTWSHPQEYTARWLFRKAAEADPKHAPVWGAWALLEWEEKEHVGEPSDPEENTARWLFRKGAQADPRHAPLWQAWARLEEEQGNVGTWSQPEKYSARWLFRRAAVADPKHVPVWHAWGILEARAGNHIGEWPQPGEFTARWLFRKAAELEPQNASTWQAWALLEAKQGNIGERVQPAQHTARWLFRKATEVDPRSYPSWIAWAHLEKSLNELALAENLFLKAVELQSDRRDASRIYFDLASMVRTLAGQDPEANTRSLQYLEAAVATDPTDPIAQAKLAKAYRFERRWEEAGAHFEEALRLSPGDEITRQWYEQMKQAHLRQETADLFDDTSWMDSV